MWCSHSCLLSDKRTHDGTVTTKSAVELLRIAEADLRQMPECETQIIPAVEAAVEEQAIAEYTGVRDVRRFELPAPRWFEHHAFTAFETGIVRKSRLYWLVLGWLIAASLVACAPKLLGVLLGTYHVVLLALEMHAIIIQRCVVLQFRHV